MPDCKVVEVLQDFLSEYVDEKFTRDYNVILFLSIFNRSRLIRCLSQCVNPKIAIFYHILFFSGDAPGAITLNVVWIEREFDAYKLCRSMYPSIFNNFPVIRTASAKKSPFSRTAAHIFVSPGDAPATKYYIDGKTIQCLPNPSQHVPICLQ